MLSAKFTGLRIMFWYMKICFFIIDVVEKGLLGLLTVVVMKEQTLASKHILRVSRQPWVWTSLLKHSVFNHPSRPQSLMKWHGMIILQEIRDGATFPSPDTCRHAEGLLTVVMLRRDLYVARRVGEREFEVEYIGDAVFFCRRDTVTDDGKLVCSCKAFEEDGIPCEHIACVVEAVMKACEGEEWKGFTVNDISVRWWSSYMYLAYRETTDDDTNAMFHWLATNDITGPSLPCAISASMPNLVGLPPPPFIC